MNKILVIDDCDSIRKLIQKILKVHGYEVLEAGSAAEGLHPSSRRTSSSTPTVSCCPELRSFNATCRAAASLSPASTA